MTIVWPGTPGESFTNTTDKILYQFVVSGINTCGVCYSYNLAIAEWWSKMHRGCNCVSVPIYPNAKSAPYEDFRKIIDDLPEDQKKKVVGDANMKLVESGKVKWDDVVTSNRVKLLREVVSINKLSIQDMISAGIKRDVAEKAYLDVNTPAHIIAAKQRTELLQEILKLGIQPQHVSEIFGDVMARKISIGAGPSGPSVIPPGKSDADWFVSLMQSFTTSVKASVRALVGFFNKFTGKPSS